MNEPLIPLREHLEKLIESRLDTVDAKIDGLKKWVGAVLGANLLAALGTFAAARATHPSTTDAIGAVAGALKGLL